MSDDPKTQAELQRTEQTLTQAADAAALLLGPFGKFVISVLKVFGAQKRAAQLALYIKQNPWILIFIYGIPLFLGILVAMTVAYQLSTVNVPGSDVFQQALIENPEFLLERFTRI